jgi:hypothetical protein
VWAASNPEYAVLSIFEALGKNDHSHPWLCGISIRRSYGRGK